MEHLRLTAELRYLAAVVACGVRRRVSGPDVAIPVPPEGIDWSRFVHEALAHGVVALACEGLQGVAVPAEQMARLRRVKQQLHVAMLLLADELVRVQDALAMVGIDVITLKGPAMAQYLYGGVGFRPSNDLDLLISAENLLKAQNVLYELGYHLEKHPSPLDQRRLNQLQNSVAHHLNFRNTDKQVAVEIHWRLFSIHNYLPAKIRKELFDKSLSVALSNGSSQILCDADQLLYLCIHGAGHSFGKMKWVADVTALVVSDQIEWDAWCRRIRLYQLQRPIVQAAMVVRDVMGVELPEPLGALVSAEKRASELASFVYVEWLRDSSAHVNFRWLRKLKKRVILRANRRHWLSIIQMLWKRPIHWPFWSLPDFLWSLNYVASPFYWAYGKIKARTSSMR